MAHGEEFEIPIVSGLIKSLDEYGINYAVGLLVIGLIFVVFGLSYIGVSQYKVVTIIFLISPLWLPYFTFHLFFEKYMEMVGKEFTLKSGRTIFEIKLPAEVFRSPEAMEFVMTQIYNAATPDNLMETYLDGKRPIPYTFELVSRGGDVHFYVTVPNKNVNALTDNMYAQYPGVEVVKQEIDYAAEIPHDLKGWSFMSFHFNKKNDEEIPIKTYIDFGLDKMPKEEEKSDPMTPMLEMLAGIRSNQQIWIQFVCIAHRKKNFKNGQLHEQGTWEKRILAKVDEIMGRAKKSHGEEDEDTEYVTLTPGEKTRVAAMERIAGKYAFEFACRVVYLSNKEFDYDGGLFGRMIRSFSQTEEIGRNGLGVRWRTDFDYKMFSDPFGKILPALKKEELHEYKSRIFIPKGGQSLKIVSVEEMATLFHLPGKVALTPTLNRVPSTRGEAPSNLPTGTLPI